MNAQIQADSSVVEHDLSHRRELSDQLLAALLAAPQDFKALQLQLTRALCQFIGAGAGISYLSRNAQQGLEPSTFTSTSEEFGCGNDCHACITRITASAHTGELARAAARYATPVPGGSVITRFGVADSPMPRCVGNTTCTNREGCKPAVACIYSIFYMPRPQCVAIGAITLFRPIDPAREVSTLPATTPFTWEDCDLVNNLHSKLFWLYELGLNEAHPTDSPTTPLPPRLVKVLEQLLSGYSEKQVAAHLSYSPHTVHTYVKAIYRHFHVSSRPELLARILGSR